jgi:hypothetical protein
MRLLSHFESIIHVQYIITCNQHNHSITPKFHSHYEEKRGGLRISIK